MWKLTNKMLNTKFRNRTRTWERCYKDKNGKYMFFSPRLYSDQKFWAAIGITGNPWPIIINESFNNCKLLIKEDAAWQERSIESLMQLNNCDDGIYASFLDGDFQLGTRAGNEIINFPVNTPSSKVTFDHIIPLKKIICGDQYPNIQLISDCIWKLAVAKSNGDDPTQSTWSRPKPDKKRYPPKEWLGALKLKKPVLDHLRDSCNEKPCPKVLAEEIRNLMSGRLEIMLQSENSKKGAS